MVNRLWWFSINLVVFSFWFFFFYIRPYRNPYRLVFVFGKKGSGKTTDGVVRAVAGLRSGRHVYTDIIISPDVPNYSTHYHFVSDPKALGISLFPCRESILILDEIGSVWNNRDFKSFNSKTRDWFKLQRQYHVTCYLYSQTFDVDLQIRNLTDEMYMASRILPSVVMLRLIKRRLVVIKPGENSESRIADELVLVSPLMCLLGVSALKFRFIPDFTRFYNTDYKVDHKLAR